MRLLRQSLAAHDQRLAGLGGLRLPRAQGLRRADRSRAATFVGLSARDTSSPASLPYPTGTKAGDVALFVLGWNNADPPTGTVRSGSAGAFWTRQSYLPLNTGGAWHTLVFLKALTEADIAAGDPTNTGNSSYQFLAVYRGAQAITERSFTRPDVDGSSLKSSVEIAVPTPSANSVGAVVVFGFKPDASGAVTPSAAAWTVRGTAFDGTYFSGAVTDRLPDAPANPTTFGLSPSVDGIVCWVFELTA